MKKNFKSVIFDLDGTLIDTIADIAHFMNRALALRSLPTVPPESYKNLVGWGMKRLALNVLPAELKKSEDAEGIAEELAADASRFYEETPVTYTKPYAGVVELVAELKRRKMKTAVLSNKPDIAANLVVNEFFPRNSFDIIRGEIAGKKRKPSPEPVWDILLELDSNGREAVFVGDSEIDIETALASGCHAVGVTWGFRSRETIVQAGAERIIDSPAELLEIL